MSERGVNVEQMRVALAKLKELDQCEPEWDQAAADVYNAMGSGHHEVLRQLVAEGPIWDGDIVSKIHRDDLLLWDLGVRVVFRNEQGYVAATYTGWSVLKYGSAAQKT